MPDCLNLSGEATVKKTMTCNLGRNNLSYPIITALNEWFKEENFWAVNFSLQEVGCEI